MVRNVLERTHAPGSVIVLDSNSNYYMPEKPPYSLSLK